MRRYEKQNLLSLVTLYETFPSVKTKKSIIYRNTTSVSSFVLVISAYTSNHIVMHYMPHNRPKES